MRLHNSIKTLMIVALACVLPACDRSPPPDATPRVPAESITGPGSVSGVVYFKGPVREQKVIRNEPCCPGAPPTLFDESIIVNANATLRNVVVTLEGGPKTDGKNLPPAELDQVFCQYVPHVLGVVVGQTLTIKSSDATTHNVHIKRNAGGDKNFWMDKAGQSTTTTFTAVDIAKTVCDVHPWMSAFIYVHDNTFFAVTDDSGAFTLQGIPPGKYTLVAWHEIFGRLEQSIDVTSDKPESLDFTYAPPTR